MHRPRSARASPSPGSATHPSSRSSAGLRSELAVDEAGRTAYRTAAPPLTRARCARKANAAKLQSLTPVARRTVGLVDARGGTTEMKRLICAVLGHRNIKVPIEGDVGYMVQCRRRGRQRPGQLKHGEWQPPQSAAGL
jgi:hypothetical protein